MGGAKTRVNEYVRETYSGNVRAQRVKLDGRRSSDAVSGGFGNPLRGRGCAGTQSGSTYPIQFTDIASAGYGDIFHNSMQKTIWLLVREWVAQVKHLVFRESPYNDSSFL